jgi:formamidopyrimidine-DNA glycosylase
MPELPEVETIVRGLKESIVGNTIKSARYSGAKFRSRAISFDDNLLINSEIRSVERKAKYILINLSNDYVLLLHLGMSGRILTNLKSKYEKHDHLNLMFQNGMELIFNDPRRFGMIKLIAEKDIGSDSLLNNLGYEPLDREFNECTMKKICENRNNNIKSVIMNSKLIVGVGNIYASESLFQAGILPTRSSVNLNSKEIEALVSAIKKVIKDAIEAGGSTLKDYVNSNGNAGNFQNNFNVYGRANKPCYVCNRPIEVVKISNRSSFYCIDCQK